MLGNFLWKIYLTEIHGASNVLRKNLARLQCCQMHTFIFVSCHFFSKTIKKHKRPIFSEGHEGRKIVPSLLALPSWPLPLVRKWGLSLFPCIKNQVSNDVYCILKQFFMSLLDPALWINYAKNWPEINLRNWILNNKKKLDKCAHRQL